jgi:hypothetical protein
MQLNPHQKYPLPDQLTPHFYLKWSTPNKMDSKVEFFYFVKLLVDSEKYQKLQKSIILQSITWHREAPPFRQEHSTKKEMIMG